MERCVKYPPKILGKYVKYTSIHIGLFLIKDMLKKYLMPEFRVKFLILRRSNLSKLKFSQSPKTLENSSILSC